MALCLPVYMATALHPSSPVSKGRVLRHRRLEPTENIFGKYLRLSSHRYLLRNVSSHRYHYALVASVFAFKLPTYAAHITLVAKQIT